MTLGPCTPWITATDLPCQFDEAPAELVAAMVAQAERFMFDATCQEYPGSCIYRVWPNVDNSGCVSTSPSTVDLTVWVPPPVHQIIQVRVDGEQVPGSMYGLVNGRWLVAYESDESPLVPWPEQRINRPDGSPGTWSVELEAGTEPPEPLVAATAELACQLVRRALGVGCDLPDNATSVSRSGVTVSLQARAEGRVGIPFIDTMIDRYGCLNGRRPRLLDPTRALTRVERVTGS